MSDLGVALVIEDDADMRNLLEAVLLKAGFDVHTATCGRDGVELVRDARPDVVTLDVGLPDIDGFEVLRRIRQFSNAYVVMLTGRTQEPDLLTALHAGADDYITKPFRPLELRARISAMMRRPRHQPPGAQPPPPHPVPKPTAPTPATGQGGCVLRHNGLALNFKSRTATLWGAGLDLTRSEFELLHELLRGAGEVRTRTELVLVARGEFYRDDTLISESDERAVEAHIGNLRRKLRDDPESPQWLQTVRGVGYRLAAERSEGPEGAV